MKKGTTGKKAAKPAPPPPKTWTEEQEKAAFWNLNLFREHPLVINHGCDPGKVLDAYISVGNARRKLTSLVFQINDPIECAIEAFWQYDHLTISQRFLTVSKLLEELEVFPHLNLGAEKITELLASRRRRKPKGNPPLSERVEFWLLDNWLKGQQVCLLNNAQIGEKVIEAGFKIDRESEQTPEDYIKKRIQELGYLKSPIMRGKAAPSELLKRVKEQVKRSRREH